MNDLINQLFDIATNEEFSPDQRRMLMRIAIDEHDAKPQPQTFVLDAALGKHLTKDRLADGTLRLGLAAHLPSNE